MQVLATDKTVWRIFASPRQISLRTKYDSTDYAHLISTELSKIFSIPEDEIYKKISNSKVLDVTIEKSADENEYLAILDIIKRNSLEDMLFTEAQTSRYYPEGTLAAHTLGFVGSDLQGLYGLEYEYNSILCGKDGEYLYAKDANGNSMPGGYASFIPAENGSSIVTTIDTFVQKKLEEQLERIRIEQSVANRVTGIVMDTETGAILAMATSSPFDPNSPYELDSESKATLDSYGYTVGSDEYKAKKRELLEIMWSNKAVSETYEPGSTFKMVTVSAALDRGAASVNDHFSCRGYLTVGGWRIKCHKIAGHGSGFDLAYGLQMSCNPTMMTIAERLGADAFYEYVERFGYLEKTGIDLPSEASTIFHKQEALGATELATASFGQRFKVSVIRHLTSLCAIANNGKLVEPYLVEKILAPDGSTVFKKDTTAVRQVIKEEIADTVADILEKGVSGDGGAKNAAVAGYKIAAKTGTSQKFDVLDENGNSYLRIGSTVGFSLSDDGGIAVIIVVDEPMGNVKYGSVVAAPYVSEVLADALPYLGYESSAPSNEIEIGSFIGMSVNTAVKKLNELGITAEVIGKGNTVIMQTPNHNDAFIKKTGKVILYTEKSAMLYSVVPKITGLSLNEANDVLAHAGLNMYISSADCRSNATVTSQSIPQGTVVPISTVIYIEALYLDFED
jgi:stage V sporulation protein D (sporulation-specific penicillin-binding protein)